MSNLLQYTLSLQDKMSKSLKAIGINSDTALDKFAKLEKQSKEVSKTFNTMGKSIGSLKQKLDLLRQEREWIPANNLRSIKAYTREIQKLEREIDKLENKGKGGFLKRIFGGGGVGNMLMRSGRAAMSLAGAAMLTAGIGSTVNAGMDAEKNRVSFEVLSGKEAGGKLFNDLTKFANESIFGSELLDNAKIMRSFGVETEKILPNMKMLGDVAMGDKEKLGQLSLAYSQIQATGRLMGQDLLQLVTAGFNPLQIISQKTGISMLDLKKKMEDGAISAEMVEAAFKTATSQGGQFYQMTEKIAKTAPGKWEAFKGQLKQIATEIGTKLLPVISKAIDLFSEGASRVYSFATSLWNDLQPVFEALWPVVQTVGDFLGRIFNIVGSIVKVITKTFAPVVKSLVNLLEGPLKVALTVVEFAFKALEKVVQAVAWAIDKVRQAVEWLSDLFNGPLDDLMKQAEKIYEERGEGAAKAYLNGFKGVNVAGNIANEISNGLSVATGSASKIKAALLPGQSEFNWKEAFLKGAPDGGNGNNSRSKASDAVATGGTKNTTIHISIGKQIEQLTVLSNNIQEGAQKIRDIIIDEMTRALAMSQSLAD